MPPPVGSMNAPGNVPDGPSISAALKSYETDNHVGRLADVVMSACPGAKERRASLEKIRRTNALVRERTQNKPITPQQQARITTVACVGAAAAAKTTAGKAMAETMKAAGVKVIWLPESATSCRCHWIRMDSKHLLRW